MHGGSRNKRPRTEPGKETKMPAKFELIAPCFFGCESTANFELRRIGAEDIRVID